MHISQPIADPIPLRLPSFSALDHMFKTIDKESTILSSFDLSIAFDTIHHHTLISFGISGIPLE